MENNTKKTLTTKKKVLLALLSLGLLMSGYLVGFTAGNGIGKTNMCEQLGGEITNIKGSSNNPECINHIIDKTCYSFTGDYCYDNMTIDMSQFVNNDTKRVLE